MPGGGERGRRRAALAVAASGDGDVQAVAEDRGAHDAGQRLDDRPGGARAAAAGTSSSSPRKPRGERPRRVEREQPAVVEQREAVEALGLVQVGGA